MIAYGGNKRKRDLSIAIGTLLVFLSFMGGAVALSDATVSDNVLDNYSDIASSNGNYPDYPPGRPLNILQTQHAEQFSNPAGSENVIDDENGLEIYRIVTASNNIIDSCTMISDPGEYILARDINNRIGPNYYMGICINISSNDVIIDGSGHTISNYGIPDYNMIGLYAHNLSNITIKNLSVYNWGSGILFENIKNGKIIDNSAIDNINGILLSSSLNNAVEGNEVAWNWYGIRLYLSDKNIISNNNASSNYYHMWWYPHNYYDEGYGIYIFESNNNILKENNASVNYYEGIYLSENSSENKIYWNNIMYNKREQAISYSLNNYWDSGYPGGGNYWSDYTGSDTMSGPNQDIPGSDGIGDTPYNISGDGGAQDRYPFIAMKGWNLPAKGDLNGNGVSSDAGDLVLMKRASIGEIPADSRYDLNNNGQFADAGDLVLMKRASIGEIKL